MKAKLFMLAAVFALLTVFMLSASAQETVNVYIDDVALSADTSPVMINSTSYVPLRAFCEALGADSVEWDERSATATVRGDGLELSVKAGKQYLYANGRYVYFPDGALIVGGRLMVPIRSVAKAFGAQVYWYDKTRSVFVVSGEAPIQSGDSFYDADSLYWLARIIHAESNGEPLSGKLAVGNVVMNRVASPEYPDTIKAVIFDTQHGVQFTPIKNGAIYNTPNEESVIAAKLTLEGYSVVGSDCIYFLNPATASRWIIDNCRYVATIGRHAFYA